MMFRKDIQHQEDSHYKMLNPQRELQNMFSITMKGSIYLGLFERFPCLLSLSPPKNLLGYILITISTLYSRCREVE